MRGSKDYEAVVTATHVPVATEHMYKRVAVVEPSVRTYSEPTGAAIVGAPEPTRTLIPPIVAPDSTAKSVPDDSAILF